MMLSNARPLRTSSVCHSTPPALPLAAGHDVLQYKSRSAWATSRPGRAYGRRSDRLPRRSRQAKPGRRRCCPRPRRPPRRPTGRGSRCVRRRWRRPVHLRATQRRQTAETSKMSAGYPYGTTPACVARHAVEPLPAIVSGSQSPGRPAGDHVGTLLDAHASGDSAPSFGPSALATLPMALAEDAPPSLAAGLPTGDPLVDVRMADPALRPVWTEVSQAADDLLRRPVPPELVPDVGPQGRAFQLPGPLAGAPTPWGRRLRPAGAC